MKTVVSITPDLVLMSIIEKTLQDYYTVISFKTIQAALDYIYNSAPNLIILDIDFHDRGALDILGNLKEEPIFSQLPVLVILDEKELSLISWENLHVEDFIWKRQISNEEMLARVNLSVIRSERIVEINPLTRLPGNISINKQIQERLDGDKVFALAYADLDHFKPFNDFYGFSRGDEVIKVTGRLVLNTVKAIQPKNSFVGHIGGDDFVYIIDLNLVEEAAGEIIHAFDRIIPTFYNAEERVRGHIESVDRQGHIRNYSLITLSIGIAHNRKRSFSHYGELTQVASSMKGHAKHFKGSCFRMDRRQSTP